MSGDSVGGCADRALASLLPRLPVGCHAFASAVVSPRSTLRRHPAHALNRATHCCPLPASEASRLPLFSMLHLRPIEPRDCSEVTRELVTNWQSTEIWSLGRRHHAEQLPGFVAEHDGRFLGAVTYHLDSGGWQGEIITLSSRSTPPSADCAGGTSRIVGGGGGVGTALLEAATNAIYAAGCVRAFLTTTNDNLRAIGFYQKRGWRFAAIHIGIVDRVRLVKPEYPLVGLNGIEIHDEIEFERWAG